MTQPRHVAITVSVAVGLLTGCVTRIPIIELGAGLTPGGHDAGVPPLVVSEPCIRGGYCQPLNAAAAEKLDLLLVVDDSPSMAEEQAALAAQLPQLIAALNTGTRAPDDPHPFLPPNSIHVGVVSTDLGLPGVAGIAGCASDGGDGARLQHNANGTKCDAMYPEFLTFNGNANQGQVGELDKFADDLACISRLGNSGCGIRQPLEAALQALWPSDYLDADGNVVEPNPIRFIDGVHGLGDVAVSDGGNRGFVRTNLSDGPSLLSIVVLSNADDCSMRNTDSFRPEARGANGETQTDVNLRCFNNKKVLYDTLTRYGTMLPKVRPARADLVTFAAIVGVPSDLVDRGTLAAVDMRNLAQREAHYDAILNDPRMQEELDPATNPGSGTGNLKPSCVHIKPDSKLELAYPPRRIVEVAKSFGHNGVVQSICQDDLGPALVPIIDTMAPHFSADCLPKPLNRQADGKVACDVIWQLPTASATGSPTPTSCDDLPFLTNGSGARPATDDRGGKNCVVQQVAVRDRRADNAVGWYYDDFSPDTGRQCDIGKEHRIAFTSSAKPPVGVRVLVDCAPQAQRE